MDGGSRLFSKPVRRQFNFSFCEYCPIIAIIWLTAVEDFCQRVHGILLARIEEMKHSIYWLSIMQKETVIRYINDQTRTRICSTIMDVHVEYARNEKARISRVGSGDLHTMVWQYFNFVRQTIHPFCILYPTF